MNEPVARSFLGTRGYIAPEIIQRREYSREVDAWALGVIVFVLLCGCMPFDDDSHNIPSDDQIRSKFRLRFPSWARGLSSSAKDLLSHLLDVNPRTRFTAEEAFEHPWVKGHTADKKSLLQSPGKIKMTPGGGKVRGTSSTLKSPLNSKATRNHMNQMMANRARANSNHRTQRQMVRKTSI